MKIIRVSPSERRKGQFTVHFEDETEIKVSAAQIADFGIYSGRELDDDEYPELCASLELSSSKTQSLRILGSRNLSSGEVKKRLMNTGVSAGTAGETVEWLEDIGAVNDTEYAAMIARHYFSKGYGAARIRDELYKRGIPRELWEDALLVSEGYEDAAQEFLEKKLRGSRDKNELRRVTDTLCRRGFSYSDACEAVRRYLENLSAEE